jgi:predicted nucleic acid-binding protein
LVLRRSVDPAELPDELAISAVTLAELAAGVQLVSGDDEAAAANGLPLYTTNPRDYEGLEALADIVAVRRSA